MILSLLGCIACIKPADPPAVDVACDDLSESRVLVVNTMTFGRRVDGVSNGFDLDGHVTDANDEEGCLQPDLVDASGREGIDNSFSAFLPVLEATEGAALEGLLQDAIDSGEMLLLFRLLDVDDWQNDDCVHLEVVQGLGTPRLGTDGVILSGQTFDVDPTVAPSRVDNLALVDGRVEARGVDLTIPMQIFDLALELTMHDAAVSLTLDSEGGASGYLGGGLNVEYIIGLIAERPDIAIGDLAIDLLHTYADLYPDEAGVCPELSAVLEFGVTSAFLFDEPPSSD